MYKILVQPGEIDPCYALHNVIADRVLLPGDIIAVCGYRYFQIIDNPNPDSEFSIWVKPLFNTEKLNEVAKPFGLIYLFAGGKAFTKISGYPNDGKAEQIEFFLRTAPPDVVYS